MPVMSYDGRSFLIDGRRIWLVSTTFEFTRYRPAQWPGLLKSIKACGFNCVCLPVPWRLVEPTKGKFDFTAERDIKKAVETAGAAGLCVFLSPGPVDRETLPDWLLGIEGMKLREANPAFLSTVSKYYSALWEQVAGLQVVTETGPGASSKSGPIVLVRLEGNWLCNSPEEGADYLHELARFHRELGCRVPLVLSNMLFHRVDTVVDAWSAYRGVTPMVRQLGSVQQTAPRLLIDLMTEGNDDSLMKVPLTDANTAASIIEAASVGAQFNLPGPEAAFGPRARRALHFTSSFAQVLAHMDPSRAPAVINPTDLEDNPGRLSLIHQTGSQGDVLFILGKVAAKSESSRVEVVLPDGTARQIAHGKSTATWSVFNAKLPGLTAPISTDVLPIAWHLGKLLLIRHEASTSIDGPESDDIATLSVNGSVIVVPAVNPGDPPIIVKGEGFAVVALSNQQADSFWPVADGVIIGPAQLDSDGNPDLSTCIDKAWHINTDGKISAIKPAKPAKPASTGKAQSKIVFSPWLTAAATAGVLNDDGFSKPTNARSIQAVGGALPLAWHLIDMPKPCKTTDMIAPDWRDKVWIFNAKGKPLGLIDAQGKNGPRSKISLESKTLLLSRGLPVEKVSMTGSEYWNMNQSTGPVGGLFAPGMLIKSTISVGAAGNSSLHKYQGYLEQLPTNHLARLQSWLVEFKTNAQSLYFRWPVFGWGPGAVFVNDVFAGLVGRRNGAVTGLVLNEANGLKKGTNKIDYFDLHTAQVDLTSLKQKKHAPELIELGEDFIAKATFKSLPVIPPGEDAFGPVSLKAKPTNTPTWFKTSWRTPAANTPVWLTVNGASAGVVLVNGVYVGQYSPDRPIVEVNPAAFRDDGEQAVVILDESGKMPGKLTAKRGD